MRLTWYLSLFVLIVSCKKATDNTPMFDGVNCSGNCFILRGVVTDTPTNKRLNNVEVRFYLGKLTVGQIQWPLPDPDEVYYLGKTYSNNNGEYEFKFNGTGLKYGSSLYYIQATKQGYIYGPTPAHYKVRNFYLDSNNFDIPFVQNFHLFFPATMKVRIKTSTVTNYKFIAFGYSYGNGIGNGINIEGGRQIDTTVTFKTAGGIQSFLMYGIYGNGISIERRDTLLPPVNGVKEYMVNF